MRKTKSPAPSPFPILPWEYPGCGVLPMPHATVRHDLGGKARNFLLKMREGRIFFKEPSRAQIYATLDTFAPELAENADALVETWKEAVARQSYGAIVVKRDYFPRLPVRAQIIFLVRPDGSALAQEHFDANNWFELPQAAVTPSLWNSGSAGDVASLLMSAAQNAVLDRALTPEQRAPVKGHFVGGTPEEFALLVQGALEAFAPAGRGAWNTLPLQFKSHSAFHAGEVDSYFGGGRAMDNFNNVWKLLLEHRPFVGLNWHEGEEADNPYPREKTQRLWKAGIEKWGDNWRGNWAPQRVRMELKFNWPLSAHDRLESRLALRDFLRSCRDADVATLLEQLEA